MNNYDELLQRLETEVVWEQDVGGLLVEAVAAIKALQAWSAHLEGAIATHQAFTASHDDALKPSDSRLWAALREKA
jgi:hypothetical protein